PSTPQLYTLSLHDALPIFEQGRGVGHRLHAQINPGKAAQRLAVIERVFERFIGKGIPLLEKVNAQHPLDADRRPPAACPSDSARSEEHTSELQSRGHLVCR